MGEKKTKTSKKAVTSKTMTRTKQVKDKEAVAAEAGERQQRRKKRVVQDPAKLEKEDEEEEDDDDDDNSSEESVEGEDDDNEDSENSDDDDDDDKERESQPKSGKLFSDENAAWLKPKEGGQKKMGLLDSDDDEDDKEVQDDEMEQASDDNDDDDDDDDDEEELEVERQSRLLDARREEEEEEADAEFRETVATHTAIYHLPTKEELERNVDRVVPPSELKSHIESILEALADFKKRREPGRSRKEYVDQLGLFIAELYGYLPELIEYFLTMFSPSEALEFVDYSDKPRPMVVRTNTLKTRRKDLAMALMKRGVTLDPLASWSKVGLKIMESPVPIGATPEYLSGHYMLQSAASMCPVLALSPQPNERVLDMSAAPGGKTSYMAQLMKNTGVIFANDLRPDRQKATVANMHRLGVKNVITCTHDGRKLAKLFKQYKFDRVLLDSPCSGLGVISRDPSVKVQRTLADVQKTVHLQKELLLAAIDVLNHKSKTGGIMVYSTCSVSVAENEEVVNYALEKRDIKIVDTELDFGTPGFTRYQQKRFHPSIANTRRFYPHVHNMDGFYVARIQKLSDNIKGQNDPKESTLADPKENEEPVDTETSRDSKAKDTSSSKKKKVKGKKRKVGDGAEESRLPSKKEKVSVPPKVPQPKSNKKRINAKTSKPRRQKVEA